MITSSSCGLSVSLDKREGCVFGVVVGLGRKLGKALASAGDDDVFGRRTTGKIGDAVQPIFVVRTEETA
jgi:hypothetical protein